MKRLKCLLARLLVKLGLKKAEACKACVLPLKKVTKKGKKK